MAMSLLLVLLTTTLLEISTACSTDEDCSLNGLCTAQSQCVCDKGWVGQDCGVLNLAPATRHTGYNLTGSSPPTSSWGGKIIPDPKDSTLHHLFAAEFTGNCGLDFWSPMSRIIRAESRSGPAGPYTFAQEIAPTFAHNPTVEYSEAEGQYLMYHIGCPFPQPTTCTAPPVTCAPGDSENGESGISLRTSKDLLTWTPHPGYVLGNGSAGAWDEDSTNPNPFILHNGTVVLFYRGCHLNCKGAEVLGFATSGTSAGPYVRASPNSILPNNPTEDPFVWQDMRGNWHVLSHSLEPGGGWGGGPKIGRHAFARDLWGQWTWGSKSLAFNTTVHFTDGSVYVFNRRERPQLLFGKDMEPLFLTTGVQAMGTGTSFTLIQPVGA